MNKPKYRLRDTAVLPKAAPAAVSPTEKPAAVKSGSKPAVKKVKTTPAAKAAFRAKVAGKGAPASLGAYFSNCLKAEREKSKLPGVYGVSEALAKVIGIPFNHLSLEFLFESNVFALERLMQVKGKEGTFKSAFTFWLAGRFAEYQGGGVVIENESKLSPSHVASIIGWDKPGVLQIEPSEDLDDAQKKLTYRLNKLKFDMTGWKPKAKKRKFRGKVKKEEEEPANKGFGRRFPVLFIFDSLAGRVSEETTRKIDEVGAAERDYSNEALALTKYLKRIAGSLINYPFAFVATNHLKIDKGPTGAISRRSPGGVQMNFGQTYELEMTKLHDTEKIVSKVDDVTDRFVVPLKIQCRKNSLGTTSNEIFVKVYWENRLGPDGKFRQHTWFDWDEATIAMLEGLNGAAKRLVSKVLHFSAAGKNRYWSKTLKVSQDSPVTASELGAMIQANQPLLDELRNILGIRVNKVFDVNKDYSEQLAEATAKILKEIDSQ